MPTIGPASSVEFRRFLCDSHIGRFGYVPVPLVGETVEFGGEEFTVIAIERSPTVLVYVEKVEPEADDDVEA